MNCNELKNETLECIINAKVWDEISSDFGLTSEMMDKFADKLNWQNVSKNSEIHWTVRLLEKWADHLDWEELSDSSNEYLLTPDIIAYFENRWNWRKLSQNRSLKLDFVFIDRFIDRWDWKEVADNWSRSELYTKEFYYRYKKYIPMADFLDNSCLLREIVNKAVEDMKKELTGNC